MSGHYLNYLAVKESVLSAEERYFLLRLSYLFPESRVDGRVRDLEQEVGLGARGFRSARDMLLTKGFLQQLPAGEGREVGPSQRGRPRSVFSLSGVLHPEVVRAVRLKPPRGVADLVERMAASRYRPLIDELLFWRLPEVGTATGGLVDLRPTSRLLLAVLLGLADRGGVVRDVGLGRIAHLVGMKKDRLEYQLEILTALGFIRARIIGLTGRYLFGQVAGAIVLNVGHQAFEVSVPQVLVCIEDEPSAQFDGQDFIDGLSVFLQMRFKAGGFRAVKGRPTGSQQPFSVKPDDPWDIRRYREATLAKVLQSMEATAPEAGEPPDGILHVRTGHDPQEGLLGGESRRMAADLWEQFELSRFLAGSPREPFGRYFQYKVDEFAGQLLSDHWREVCSWPGEAVPVVLERIKREVVTTANLQELKAWNPPASLMDAFSLCIYLIILRRAYWFKSVLTYDLPKGALGGNPGDCDYVLLPPVYSDRQRLAVLAITRHPVAVPADRIVAIRRRAEPSTQPVWRLAAAENLPEPSTEQLQLFWRHPNIRPAVIKGLAARQEGSEDDPASPGE